MQIHSPAVTETDQRIYADRVAALLPTLYGETPLACVVTYGCQQNVSDSERFKGQLTAMGYRLTEDRQAAHLVLFNTCAVREHAEDRVYGNIGRTKAMKEKDRNRLVVVCGCMAQRESVAEKIRRSYPYVDIVFGTQVQHRLAEFVYRRLTAHERVFEREMDNGEIPEEIPVCRDGGPKGWLPIMYGCNNFCTYCIVPYARGRERSREPERILAEAKEMLAAGYRDITLLGQNVNSYGKGAAHGVNFAELLRRLNALDGEFILRFMTSHPKDCTKELIDTIRDCEKVSHHLHLPFQSGSDRILKRMNRQYDREKYLELIAYAKEQISDLSLTSDVIVGFPGETYEDFCETLSLIKTVRFSSLFTFLYSPREGTPAAVMDDPVSREEKGKWFDELLRAQERISTEILHEQVGKTLRVLCDGKGSREGFLSARAVGTATVEFPGAQEQIGTFVNVRVSGAEGGLTGTIVS